jgi:hypothetical protein
MHVPIKCELRMRFEVLTAVFPIFFRRKIFVRSLSQSIVCRTAAIVVSQPFNVITVRMMAQFVGGENKYW